jgi:hypothetical protein
MARKPTRKSIRPFSVEQHGSGWRARVRDPATGGLTTVASGCESAIEAEAAGWKYLNDVTEGTWRDPQRGQMHLRTCMDNHGVQKVLRDLVMGHHTAGMEGVYAHVTPQARAALTAADEADWESSLTARAAISLHSPVPVLDTLLAPFRNG